MFEIKDFIARLTTRFFGLVTRSDRAFVYLVNKDGKIKRFYIDEIHAEVFGKDS